MHTIYEDAEPVISSNDKIRFPFKDSPENKEIKRINDNIFWARMKIPYPLNHVNVYILKDPESLTIVDTGMNTEENKELWQEILEIYFVGLPVSRVILTHHHPDHFGLAGWFKEKFGSKIYSSRTSYLMARMLTLDVQTTITAEAEEFYIRAGMPKDILEDRKIIRPMNFADLVYYIPLGFQRIQDGESIEMAGESWRIIFGNGHAPAHATFWSNDSNILIAGDQVLPGISSNLGVYPSEPDADTVGDWIESCKKFKSFSANDKLVLPGHKLPFFGLTVRLDQLIRNHKEALKRIEDELSQEPLKTVELFGAIFMRDLKDSEYGLALSEAVGHMNHLYKKGKIVRKINHQGAYLLSKA